jgi:hypothetical protein
VKKFGMLIVLRTVLLLLVAELSDAYAQTNTPPQVSILWPDSNTDLTLVRIKIKANALSSGYPIAQVQFFIQSTNLIGTVTNSPFNILWDIVAFGDQFFPMILTAVATDSLGLSATSAPVRLFVAVGAPPTPIVKVTSPPNASVFAAPATFLHPLTPSAFTARWCLRSESSVPRFPTRSCNRA